MTKDERECLNDIRRQLTRIADALVLLVVEALGPPETEAPTVSASACQHPPELRIDFGTTNGKPDWQCGVETCGYRTPTT